MQVRLLGFGSIEVEGRKYENDIVIDGGRVRERKKKPSKQYRDEYGHTPLSADEELPWGGGRLIIGTGAYGSLPIMPQVLDEARRRGVVLAATPTKLGATVTDFHAGPTARWDRGNVLRVTMAHGAPASADPILVLGGANLAAIENADGEEDLPTL